MSDEATRADHPCERRALDRGRGGQRGGEHRGTRRQGAAGGRDGGDPAASTLAGILARSCQLQSKPTWSPSRTPNHIKARYLGGQHQIKRRRPRTARRPTRKHEDSRTAAVDMLADDCDAIMISDYAKGALTDRVLAAIMAAGKKTNVQHHRRPQAQ